MDKIVKIIEAAADLLESRKNITSPQQYALELAKEVAKLSSMAERDKTIERCIAAVRLAEIKSSTREVECGVAFCEAIEAIESLRSNAI